MLSKEQMLKIDPELAKLSDAEFTELRDTMYAFAQLAWEAYSIKKHGSKSPVWSFPPEEERDKI